MLPIFSEAKRVLIITVITKRCKRDVENKSMDLDFPTVRMPKISFLTFVSRSPLSPFTFSEQPEQQMLPNLPGASSGLR